MRFRLFAPILCAAACVAGAAAAAPSNVVLFVADGLRPGMVNAQTMPAMTALLKSGVRFVNAHSMFPTFTTPNASALATGHKLGDTGDFSNTLYLGFEVPGAGGSLTPFIESDPVLADIDAHFSGDYLNQETVMKAARCAGYSTASIGKLGPALIFDHAAGPDDPACAAATTLLLDDMTGNAGGRPLTAEIEARLTAAGLGVKAPGRGDNRLSGDSQTPGTLQANVAQQAWFLAAATQVALPLFKERGKPFMMVYWSRDPDGTQHNQGDSLNRLVPGINGPTSLAAIRNADDNLAALLAALKANGLEDTTDVFVVADHGFSTISKESATSFAATQRYGDVAPGLLPPGFVALDLAHALGLPLLDPDAKYAAVADGAHSARGNGLIGPDKGQPQVVVAANGGSDLVYLPNGDKDLARKLVDILAAQDYVSGLFVSDSLGPIEGTLPLSAIDLRGTAVTPIPAIVVNFRSFTTGCANPLNCGVEVADTPLQQGQGMHGSFSRADTAVITGVFGPDFRAQFVDWAPTGNADLGRTMAQILGLDVKDIGALVGRVLTEAMPNGAMPEVKTSRLVSEPDRAGRVTMVAIQSVGPVRYFDAAGYPGLTLGLQDPDPAAAAAAE